MSKPRVSLFWPNGGDASTRYATPRKVEGGFCRDVACHIAAGEPSFLPDSFIDHGPHGWNDPANMELDSFPMVRADPRWVRLADEEEYVRTKVLMYETSVYLGKPAVQEQYLGAPEGSVYLVKAWQDNRTQFWNRVDLCFRPIRKVAARGVPVRVWIDGAGRRDKNSMSAAVVKRVIEKYRIPVGVEPMLGVMAADWANREDIAVMSHELFWDRADRNKYADATESMFKADMLGEQVIIVTEQKVSDKSQADRAKVLIRGGTSVAVIGAPAGYPTAAALLAEAGVS